MGGRSQGYQFGVNIALGSPSWTTSFSGWALSWLYSLQSTLYIVGLSFCFKTRTIGGLEPATLRLFLRPVISPIKCSSSQPTYLFHVQWVCNQTSISLSPCFTIYFLHSRLRLMALIDVQRCYTKQLLVHFSCYSMKSC